MSADRWVGMHSENIDQREVARFSRLSAEWWARDGKFKALHALTPARMTFIRSAAAEQFGTAMRGVRVLSGKSAVDVGCGGGLACEPMARLGAVVTGIDPSPENIAVARDHAAASGLDIRYEARRAEDLVLDGRTFDIVVALEVIEHVPNPAAFVATCASLLAPGGLMVLSTLNRTLRAYALAIVAGEYILGWLERGTHDWNRFVTPEELAGHLRDNGLTPRPPKGTIYAPLADTWRLSDDVGVNYMIAAGKPL